MKSSKTPHFAFPAEAGIFHYKVHKIFAFAGKTSVFFILLCLPAITLAQEVQSEVLPTPEEEKAQFTGILCKILPEHQPEDGVNYVSGIDVNGNQVPKADLNQFPDIIEQAIVIPVEVDLIERFNLNVSNGVELKPTVSNLHIHMDGRVEYNGHDVSDQAYYLCGQGEEPPPAMSKQPDPPPKPPAAPKPAPAPPPVQDSGQNKADTLPSGGIIEGQHP